MCGRASLATDPDELRAIFELDQVPELPARYNMAPSQPLPIIREPHRLELVHWGLPKGHGAGINVRVESVARAPAYRESFWKRRCLVVVDGFYEWKKEGKVRQPFMVRRVDGRPFALAGIWEHSATKDGEIIDACAIITGEANGVVAPLHDRMPLIVPIQGYARWLSHDAKTPELLKLIETDASTLVSFPVSRFVNSAANEGPQCVEPAERSQ
jgi:putative SOS response-associated peptidase YedK